MQGRQNTTAIAGLLTQVQLSGGRQAYSAEWQAAHLERIRDLCCVKRPGVFCRQGRGGVWVVTQTNRRTRAESQQIVATRPLYCLQYPVLSQSSAEDLPRRAFEIVMHGTGFRLVTLTGEPMDML